MNKKCSFILTNTIDKLELNLTEQYCDFSNGTWGLKIDRLLINSHELNLDFNCVIYSSAVSGKYLTRPGLIEQKFSPLGIFNFNQQGDKFESITFNDNWFQIDNFGLGKIKFFLKDVANEKAPLPISHKVTIFVLIKRLS